MSEAEPKGDLASTNIKLKVKVGLNEVEIEAPLRAVREALEVVPELLQKLSSFHSSGLPDSSAAETPPVTVAQGRRIEEFLSSPNIQVDKSDSLSDIITKMFRDEWGKQPRRLSQVKEALESLGLHYPKQSVAVTLLRLAQSGRLRRFKQEGEFIYTSSTSLGS